MIHYSFHLHETKITIKIHIYASLMVAMTKDILFATPEETSVLWNGPRRERSLSSTLYPLTILRKPGRYISDLKDYCILGTKEEKMLEQMFRSMDLSGRAYHRLLKTARTIADIEECEQINEYHLSEAVCFFGGMKGGVFNEK